MCPLCVFNTTSPNCSMKNHRTRPQSYTYPPAPPLLHQPPFSAQIISIPISRAAYARREQMMDPSYLSVEQGRWLLQGRPSHCLALPVVAGEGGNWDLHIPSKCAAGDFKGFQSDSLGKTQPNSSLAKKPERASKDGTVPAPELEGSRSGYGQALVAVFGCCICP